MNDLFPETLLVSHDGGRIYTDTLRVAAHFGKRHDNVLKAVQRILEMTSNPVRRLNFEVATYVDAQGKPRLQYLLTEEGFGFVTMGFTGEKAHEWKWRFLEAFMEMRRELAARDRRYVRALSQVRPALIPVVEMTNKGMSRAAIAAPLKKSPAAITYHRRAARSLGLLEGRAG
ncbi:MAG: Rha family transcriptional regulator [Azoarcus sp.]|jgi:Rha family phage regulatory protein|nr:Rha family transcriptional regulator [Azoarcus sp.]